MELKILMPLFHITPKKFYKAAIVEMNYRIEKKEEIRVVGIKRNFQGPKDDFTNEFRQEELEIAEQYLIRL